MRCPPARCDSTSAMQQGNPQFIGENGIGHTPMGSDLSLRTGDAFDVYHAGRGREAANDHGRRIGGQPRATG